MFTATGATRPCPAITHRGPILCWVYTPPGCPTHFMLAISLPRRSREESAHEREILADDFSFHILPAAIANWLPSIRPKGWGGKCAIGLCQKGGFSHPSNKQTISIQASILNNAKQTNKQIISEEKTMSMKMHVREKRWRWRPHERRADLIRDSGRGRDSSRLYAISDGLPDGIRAQNLVHPINRRRTVTVSTSDLQRPRPAHGACDEAA